MSWNINEIGRIPQNVYSIIFLNVGCAIDETLLCFCCFKFFFVNCSDSGMQFLNQQAKKFYAKGLIYRYIDFDVAFIGLAIGFGKVSLRLRNFLKYRIVCK